MTSVANDLTRAAIVVAHPDDEILWFSSLVAKVGRIVMCYGAISPTSERAANRRNAIKAYPLDTVEFLDLPIPRSDAPDAGSVQGRVLIDRLAASLRGVTAVFTHNPWGEYGQPDHQRVYAAIDSLRGAMDFAVYVSCYAARHQWAELQRTVKQGVGEVISYPIRHAEIDPILALYRSNSCWTWARNWQWPKREHFLRLESGASAGAAEIPVHVFGSRTKSRAEMRQIWHSLFTTRTRERIVSAVPRNSISVTSVSA